MYVGVSVYWHTCCRTVSSSPKSVYSWNAGIIDGGKLQMLVYAWRLMEPGASVKLDDSPSAGWNCIRKENEDNSYRIYPHKAVYFE
jgi:hypothetical protein